MTAVMIFLLKYWRYIALALFLAAVCASLIYSGYRLGVSHGEAQVRAQEVAQAKQEAKAAQAFAKATEEQAERYRIKAESQEAISAQYLKELNNANRKGDKLAADLQSGTVRFNRLWAQCQNVPVSGQTSSSPSESYAGIQERAESAARIIRAAAECDAQVRGLQKVVQCDRGLHQDCGG